MLGLLPPNRFLSPLSLVPVPPQRDGRPSSFRPFPRRTCFISPRSSTFYCRHPVVGQMHRENRRLRGGLPDRCFAPCRGTHPAGGSCAFYPLPARISLNFANSPRLSGTQTYSLPFGAFLPAGYPCDLSRVATNNARMCDSRKARSVRLNRLDFQMSLPWITADNCYEMWYSVIMKVKERRL